jgi:hypothetical protein
MEVAESIMANLANANKKEIMVMIIGLETLATLAFVICSFVVAGTANVGFNCVLTGFLNIAFVAGSYYVITNSKSPIAVGFLIGTSGMITILSFMTAVFWGQLSNCDRLVGITQYTCTNKVAYGAVCAFAVILFLLQGAFSAAVIVWRGDLINETGLYDDISSSPSSHIISVSPYEFQSSGPPRNFANPPPSADL